MKKLIIAILILLPSFAFAGMQDAHKAVIARMNVASGTSCSISTDYIGNQDQESTAKTLEEDRLYCIAYSPVCTSGCTSGTFDTAYVEHSNTSSQNVKMLIYLDDGDGLPDSGDSLVTSSGAISCSTDEEWANTTLSGTAVCSNTYHICVVTDDTTWGGFSANENKDMYYLTIPGSYDSPPSTLAGTFTRLTREISMYATVGP